MASSDILVTVLMPCYNAAPYLHAAVDSILRQTHSNIEVLLIDDGSSDSTREIIAQYAQSDARVVPVYNERNLGLIRTLNKGISLARGEFIARMDADDISSVNRIEILLDTAVRDPEIMVVSAGYYYLSVTGKVLRRIHPKAIDSQALKFVSFFCTPVNHPCSMIRTSLLQKHYFDELYIHSEDYEIFSRILLENYKIINIPEPLYYLRINPQSVSFRFETIQISTHTKISARNIEQYFNRNYDFFLHKVMINRISFNVPVSMMKIAFRSLEELKEEFYRKEKLTSSEKNQIEEFLIEQKIDIFFQSMKYASWLNRVRIVAGMMANVYVFLNPRGLQYLRSKVRFTL
jgi:glycosyltransferase involved in cell wall biosynthesis